MIWIILGTLLMSFVFPLARLVDYCHSHYISAIGETQKEKFRHYRRVTVALGQFIIVVGLVMFVWGVCDEFVKDNWLVTRQEKQQDVEFSKYPTYPGGF